MCFFLKKILRSCRPYQWNLQGFFVHSLLVTTRQQIQMIISIGKFTFLIHQLSNHVSGSFYPEINATLWILWRMQKVLYWKYECVRMWPTAAIYPKYRFIKWILHTVQHMHHFLVWQQRVFGQHRSMNLPDDAQVPDVLCWYDIREVLPHVKRTHVRVMMDRWVSHIRGCCDIVHGRLHVKRVFMYCRCINVSVGI